MVERKAVTVSENKVVTSEKSCRRVGCIWWKERPPLVVKTRLSGRADASTGRQGC